MSSESELFEHICKAIQSTADAGVGVAFSGGVDSSLVALACERCGLEPTLLTIGFAGSHDVRFASHIAKMINLKHGTRIIDSDDVSSASAHVDSIVGECSMSWRENCIGFFHVCLLASSLGLRQVITANGIDELFCGYNAYRDVAQDESAVLSMMHDKLDNETRMVRAVNDVTAKHGVSVTQPLLADDFVEYAMRIPLAEKITGSDDLLRKHIVRRTANLVGVPYKSAYSRKKALQYGSGIHRALVRTSNAQQSD